MKTASKRHRQQAQMHCGALPAPRYHAAMATTHLLYLHGFRSSPQSTKARTMAAWVAQHHPSVVWHCPQLPASPHQALAEVMSVVSSWPAQAGFESMAVVGSSLGGFYATWVAEKMQCKAVLLNPAVDPAKDLAQYIGEQTFWHAPEETFFFRPEFVEELRALHAGPLAHPQHYLAVMAKGDEVLDWRDMAARYAQAQQCVLEGGDHALSNFDALLPQIMDFLALR